MITRTKVVPPVTPKIVQSQPRQQLFRYALIAGVLFFFTWLGYFYGRTDIPASVAPGSEVATQDSTAQQQQMAALEQERDELRRQVGELEASVGQLNRALQAAKTPASVPRQPPRDAPLAKSAVISSVEETGADSVTGADYSLSLANVRIEQTGVEDTYRVGFSVFNDADTGDRVTGTIWIAINGHNDRQPVRLSLKRLSPGSRPFVKMGFEQQQDIDQEVMLPAGFLPKNVLIEVKPYGDKYTGTSEKISWEIDN